MNEVSANNNLCVESASPLETEEVAKVIGGRLRGGEIIELVSDLGGGKTTFTKGIALGIGSEDNVSSPTFTLSKSYRGKTLEIRHYDFYRLGELGLMEEELQEVLNDAGLVTVIEWAKSAHQLLPQSRLLRIELVVQPKSESHRVIKMTHTDNLSYLTEAMGAKKC